MQLFNEILYSLHEAHKFIIFRSNNFMSPTPKEYYQKHHFNLYNTGQKFSLYCQKDVQREKSIASVMNRSEKRPTVPPNPKCLRSCDYLDLEHFNITF